MAAGPLVCGAGLFAFARLDERADYVTGVLPASGLFGVTRLVDPAAKVELMAVAVVPGDG